jgi:hypothetical protein
MMRKEGRGEGKKKGMKRGRWQREEDGKRGEVKVEESAVRGGDSEEWRRE